MVTTSRKSILFLLAALLLGAMIAACGGSQPTQTPIVVTATPLPTAIIVTSPPVTVIVPVTVTPPLPTAQPSCPGAPTIAFFAANPATITQGQSTILQWGQVLNASAVGIDQGIGGVPAPGQSQVTPNQTTTYTMIATGCGGQTQKSVTVTVQGAPTNLPPPTNPPPPTNVPATATTAPCNTDITNVQVSAPSNPGTVVNITATECYDGSQGEGVNVTATAQDASGTPIVGVTVPSVSAGTNKEKSINLSITMLLGAQPPPSTQVQLCFTTPQGANFNCFTEPFAMTWQ